MGTNASRQILDGRLQMTPASAKGPKTSIEHHFEPSPGLQENEVLILENSLPGFTVDEDLQGIDRDEFTQRAYERYFQYMRGYFGQVMDIDAANQLIEQVKNQACLEVFEEYRGEIEMAEQQER